MQPNLHSSGPMGFMKTDEETSPTQEAETGQPSIYPDCILRVASGEGGSVRGLGSAPTGY